MFGIMLDTISYAKYPSSWTSKDYDTFSWCSTSKTGLVRVAGHRISFSSLMSSKLHAVREPVSTTAVGGRSRAVASERNSTTACVCGPPFRVPLTMPCHALESFLIKVYRRFSGDNIRQCDARKIKKRINWKFPQYMYGQEELHYKKTQ